MLPHINEFSRFAKEYISSNHIQQEIAKHLISLSTEKFNSILDLGCGGGEVYNNISWDFNKFVAIDSSFDMCSFHPRKSNISVIQANFDNNDLFFSLKKSYHFDVLISSSSLHWSRDIDNLVCNIATIADNILISVITNNSFKKLHNSLNIKSPLYSKDKIINSIKRYFCIDFIQLKDYTINFNSSKELLTFIKHTGIGGGKQLSSVKDILNLIKEDTIKTLEFEVLFIRATLK